MKKTDETKDTLVTDYNGNNVALCGKVTFAKGSDEGKWLNFGIKCEYTENGKSFTATPTVSAYASVEKVGFESLTQIEAGDIVEVVGHFSTSKYKDKEGKDKFTTTVVATSIIVTP